MCGIAAIYSYGAEGGPPVEEILRVRDAMFSRGPDDFGHWISLNRRVQLAHRRLSIIDLSPTGAQPMLSPDGSLVISFNGEIYNHPELRARLEVEGCRFRGTCDTEVLLHLYALHGREMVNKLRGMYAFALWDKRRQGLFLARDPLGIKPLYYSDNGESFRAASQVKALLAGGGVDSSVDAAGHVGFFLWGHIPEPFTLYRGIRSLSPGAQLWVDRSGAKVLSTFCNARTLYAGAEAVPDASTAGHPRPSATPSPRLHSFVSSEHDTLRIAVNDSVRRHLLADVPVGLFLSSGLDSAAIAAVAAGQGTALQTITLGFEEYRGTIHDETPLAEQLAEQLGTRHHTTWFTRNDFDSHADHFLAAMDQPTIDGLNTYFVSLAAARLCVKAALSGLGGDELFAGYDSFRQIPRVTNLLAFCKSWRTLGKGFRLLASPVLDRAASPKYAGLLEYGGTLSGAYLLRRGLFMPWELPQVLDPELAQIGWDQLQSLDRLEDSIAGLRSKRLKVSCLESSWYLQNQLLRDADWAGLAHSIEIRTPFVDAELIHRVGPLFANGSAPSKSDVIRACAPSLPESLFRRRKTGFSVPLGHWLSGGRSSAKGTSVPPGGSARAWARFVYSQFVKN